MWWPPTDRESPQQFPDNQLRNLQAECSKQSVVRRAVTGTSAYRSQCAILVETTAAERLLETAL